MGGHSANQNPEVNVVNSILTAVASFCAVGYYRYSLLYLEKFKYSDMSDVRHCSTYETNGNSTG